MLKIKLLLLCTVISCVGVAQMDGEKTKDVMNEDNLFLRGEITEYFEGDFLPGTIIKATSDGKVVSQGTSDSEGKFELVLHFDKQYQISFSRGGFVSKKMIIDTRGVPDHKHYKCPDMDIEITLFKPMKCIDMGIMSKPVARFIYFPKKNVIDPDMDYSGPILASINDMLNDCVEQLEEEAVEEEKRKEEEAEQKRLAEEQARKEAALAEQKRLEEEKAKEEAKRKAEEEARLAEQKKIKEEQERKEAALAEQKRLEEERAKEEARRKEEEAAKAAAEKAKEEEEAARAAELAEQQRLASEKAEEEARKRGDEAKAAELAEQRRLAEKEAKKEAQRKEEERARKAALAEQKKMEEERKREEELAEQRRLADEKAKEEARRAEEQAKDKVEKRDLVTQKSLPKKKPKTTPKKQPVRPTRPSYSREKKDYSNTMLDSRLVLETVIGYKQIWDPVKKKWKKEPILQDVEYSPH